MDFIHTIFEEVYIFMLLPLVCSVYGWLGSFLYLWVLFICFGFFHFALSSFHLLWFFLHLLRVLDILKLFWLLVAFPSLIKT